MSQGGDGEGYSGDEASGDSGWCFTVDFCLYNLQLVHSNEDVLSLKEDLEMHGEVSLNKHPISCDTYVFYVQ